MPPEPGQVGKPLLGHCGTALMGLSATMPAKLLPAGHQTAAAAPVPCKTHATSHGHVPVVPVGAHACAAACASATLKVPSALQLK